MPPEINSQTEYESALERINELWGAEPDTDEGVELDTLFDAVEKYEIEHFPMDEPESYAAVEYHLERLNMSISTLPIPYSEKMILETCIANEQLVPEWLLVKIGNLLGVSRDLLGRSDESSDPIVSNGAKVKSSPIE